MTLGKLLSIADGGIYCDIYDSSTNRAITTNCLVAFVDEVLFSERISHRKVESFNITSLGNLEIWIK